MKQLHHACIRAQVTQIVKDVPVLLCTDDAMVISTFLVCILCIGLSHTFVSFFRKYFYLLVCLHFLNASVLIISSKNYSILEYNEVPCFTR